MFASESSNASHSPYDAEPGRMSTSTSTIAPRAQRTSFAAGGSTWKCMPRITPRADREWLSCTNSSRTPRRANALWRKDSTKKPRSSPWTGGCSRIGPSRRVGRRSMQTARSGGGGRLAGHHRVVAVGVDIVVEVAGRLREDHVGGVEAVQAAVGERDLGE